MVDVILAAGRDRSVRRRHPWIWSGAVERIDGEAAPGACVAVRSSAGELLGYGHYAPDRALRIRMLSFGKDVPDDDWLAAKIAHAVLRRAEDPALAETDAVRLVNAEGDGLPGLVVDRYADTLVLKLTSIGMAERRDVITAALRDAAGAADGFERADAVAARREGFAAQQGVLWGSAPSDRIGIREGALRFEVDVVAGQKTGFYLDQREARFRVRALSKGRRVLDLFSYTGGFAVAAAHGGARSVTLVDSSAEALDRARAHIDANAPTCPASFERHDAFHYVRGSDESFDLIVVDPPPLARNRRDVQRASRAYKDVLLFSLRRARPDALVLAFACSHHVGPELFRKVVFGASLDAGRPVQVLDVLGAPVDHPVSLDHPEGAYLTGLLLRA